MIRTIVEIYAVTLLLGITGLAVYAGLFMQPAPETPWIGRALHYVGLGVLVVAMLALAGAVVGGVASAVFRAMV